LFTAKISDTKSWKNSISAIAALIDEGTFEVSENGLKLRAMDPSQISLVDFELPSKAFEEYKVDKTQTFGVDFIELSKITKRVKPEDKIEISLDKRLKIVFKGKTTRSFNLGVIESTTAPPKEPKIEFSAEVKLGPDVLKDALKDAELVSNHVAVSIKDSLTIKAEGDTGSAEIQLGSENILSKSVKEEARAVFSLEHLNNLLLAAESPAVVILKLRTDAPLRIEYAVGEGRVVYYLAPRIETV
jgi:proliferating cell nuclear antigen